MTSISRLLILCSGILFFINYSWCQQNYVPSTVVLNDGTQVEGYIDYKNWKRNPKKVDFKNSADGDIDTYTPLFISSFRTADEIYNSAIVDAEVSLTNTNKLDKNGKFRFQRDTVFLQTLVAGEKNLYYYKNKDGRENFYIGDNGNYELLTYKLYLDESRGKDVKRSNNSYRLQLSKYLDECPDMNKNIMKSTYTKKGLSRIFQSYYNCIAVAPDFVKTIENVVVDFGAFAGLGLTDLAFSSTAFDRIVNASYDQDLTFTGGLYADVILPRSGRKWSIYNELAFSYYLIKGEYEEVLSENNFSNTDSEIGYAYLKLNNLVRYKYPVGSTYIFVNGGLSNGVALQETNSKKKVSNLFGTIRTEEDIFIRDTRKYEQGLLLGIGVISGNYSLEARYERGNGMSSSSGLDSVVNRYSLQAGYRF